MKNKMTRGICFTLSLLLAIALASTNALAVNEDSVGVSCQFLDSSGDPITGANVVVSIYNASTGGSQLYSETFNSATDSNGVCTFNTLASSSTLPLTEGQEYFLDLTVNGNDYDFNGIERQAFIAWFGQNKQVSGDVAAAGNLSGANFQADSSNTRAGVGSSTTANSGTAYGENTVAGDNAVSVGTNADATNAWTIAVGSGSNAQSNGAISIGYNNFATNGAGAVSIGQNAAAQDNGDGQIAIGREASARDNKAIAIGDDVDINAGGSNSVVLGHTYSGAEANQFIYFPGSEVFRANATGAYTAGTQLLTVNGSGSQLTGVVTGTGVAENIVRIGNGATTTGFDSIAIGDSSTGSNQGATAVGYGAFAQDTGSSFGINTFSVVRGVAVGREAQAREDSAIAIGYDSYAEHDDFLKGAVAIGDKTTADGDDTFVFGRQSSSTGINVTTIGPATHNTQSNSFLFGYGGTQYLLANQTGVFDINDQLATQSYVQANAGVDESANYTWTGTHNYTGASLSGVVTGSGNAGTDVRLGNTGTVSGSGNHVVIGELASVNTLGSTGGSISIGDSPSCQHRDGICIGTNSGTAGLAVNGGIAIGENTRAYGGNSVSIGTNADVDGTAPNSVIVGVGGAVNAQRGVALGDSNTINAEYSSALGAFNTVGGQNSTVLGRSNTVNAANTFAFGVSDTYYLYANSTGVFDINDQLATQSYVQANAGVDESANYNWTGTNRFTNTANEFTGTSFTLDDGSVITDNGSCTTIASPYGTNQISLCANDNGITFNPFTFWSTTPPNKQVEFSGCLNSWELDLYMNGNWEHAVDNLSVTYSDSSNSYTLSCTLSDNVGSRSCSDSQGLGSMSYSESTGSWDLDVVLESAPSATLEAFADGESSGTFTISEGGSFCG